MAARRRVPKWAKRRGASRWVRLLSWIVGAVVWLWVINGTSVRYSRFMRLVSSESDLDADLMISSLSVVAMATVVAAIAMYLVRLIGRGVAWLNLRF